MISLIMLIDGLTVKQHGFVKDFIALKGNGTQAALKNYDTDDDKTASVISAENLVKPRVREAILKAFERAGFTLKDGVDILSEQLQAKNEDLRHYLRMFFELQDAFPDKTSTVKQDIDIKIEQRTIDVIVDASRRAYKGGNTNPKVSFETVPAPVGKVKQRRSKAKTKKSSDAA